MDIVTAITGASGALYAQRFIQGLVAAGVRVHLVISPLGRRLLHDELGMETPDLAALATLQAELLDALWPALAPGGVLLYATCSILPEENSRQVRAFIERRADAALEPLDARFGRDTGFGSQRLPGEGGMDGFFVARLRKH